MKSTLKIPANKLFLDTMQYSEVISYITYKSMQRGIKINPSHTSQIYSNCGKRGTRSKGFFVCSHCSYSLNADLNASLNLARHQSMTDGAWVALTQPHIQSDDDYCATAVELMDKSPP